MAYLEHHNFIAWIVVGAIAGFLAGKVVRGGGFGLFGDIIVGIVGAYISTWLLPRLHISLAHGFFGSILDATLGALALLIVIRIIRAI